MHPTELPQATIDRLMKRRGRIHAFDAIDPRKTALVVVDMQNGFCAAGSSGEVATAKEIVPNINRLAAELRAAGGLVAWVSMTLNTKEEWPIFMDTLISEKFADHVFDDLRPGSEGHKIWPELKTEQDDLFVTKNRFSCFLPSASDLPKRLKERGIDTVLITGTLTNVCCESSARDAAMSDYKTVMVSDANACRSDDDHLATLKTFIQAFGDVQSTEQIVALIRAGATRYMSAAE